jgi:hypothetical protein
MRNCAAVQIALARGTVIRRSDELATTPADFWKNDRAGSERKVVPATNQTRLFFRYGEVCDADAVVTKGMKRMKITEIMSMLEAVLLLVRVYPLEFCLVGMFCLAALWIYCSRFQRAGN